MGPKEIKQILAEIPGLLSDKEGEYLYLLARNDPRDADIVEIGSWLGKSTIWLAKGSEAGSRNKVFAIDLDLDSTSERFRRNIEKANVAHLILPMVMESEEAGKLLKDRPIKLLWIDGSHEYQDVNKDFHLYEQHLLRGGVVAFHDWTQDGPARVIRENILKNSKFSNIRVVGEILSAQKVERCSMSQKFIKIVLYLPLFSVRDLISMVTNNALLSPIMRKIIKMARRLLKRDLVAVAIKERGMGRGETL